MLHSKLHMCKCLCRSFRWQHYKCVTQFLLMCMALHFRCLQDDAQYVLCQCLQDSSNVIVILIFTSGWPKKVSASFMAGLPIISFPIHAVTLR